MISTFSSKLRVYFAAPTVSSTVRRKTFEAVKQAILNLNCELTYDWMEDDKKYNPKELFQKSSQAIKSADLVIAEVTFSSTGVGQQINIAVENKIPVIALHTGKKTSVHRFLAGSQGDMLKIFNYLPSNLEKILRSNIRSFQPVKFAKFNFISTPDINSELDSKGEKMGLSRSQLVRQIIYEWTEKKGLSHE